MQGQYTTGTVNMSSTRTKQEADNKSSFSPLLDKIFFFWLSLAQTTTHIISEKHGNPKLKCMGEVGLKLTKTVCKVFFFCFVMMSLHISLAC